MMVPFLRGIRGMKVYTLAIWHDWENHFEFVFLRRKTEVPPRDYSLLPCPIAARTLLITPRGLSTARCTIAGREVKVERFTLKCILITYYQRVSEGRKEDI